MTPESDPESIAIGVVGCGAIAQVVHLPILSELPNVTLHAICDPNPTKAETVSERFGIPIGYRSFDEFLDDPELEAVVICTPNHLHARQCEAALRSGRDVLCERPLGTDRSQVTHLIEVARDAGRHLMVAHNHRYRPDAMALRRLIAAGDLGDVYHVHVSWHRRRLRRPRPWDWRRDRKRAGGGVLMDLGVHTLDLGLWLIDYPTPETVSAHLHSHPEQQVEHGAVVSLRLANERTLTVEVTWELIASQDIHGLQALGTRGFGSLSPFRVHVQTEQGIVDATPELPPGTENVYTASYRRELDHFVAVIRGEQDAGPPADQEVLMSIVDACYRSAEERREIVL